jgi:hypothetical protein
MSVGETETEPAWALPGTAVVDAAPTSGGGFAKNKPLLHTSDVTRRVGSLSVDKYNYARYESLYTPIRL